VCGLEWGCFEILGGQDGGGDFTVGLSTLSFERGICLPSMLGGTLSFVSIDIMFGRTEEDCEGARKKCAWPAVLHCRRWK